MASAFLVGLFSGLGLQFLRLVDKLNLLYDLAFYASIIGACYAPIAVVSRLMQEQRELWKQRQQSAELEAENEAIEARNSAKLAQFEEEKQAANWFRRWGMSEPPLEKLKEAPTDTNVSNAIRRISPIPFALLVAVSSYVLLGEFYAAAFWIVAAVIMLPLLAIGSWTTRLSGLIVCALVFGFLHAEALRAEKPDTRLQLTTDKDVGPVTIVMTTQRGVIALSEQRHLSLVPWSLIRSVSVDPKPSVGLEAVRSWLDALRQSTRNAEPAPAKR